MTTLENKTALVTGASRGIGRATAQVLAKAGAHVLVHYGRSRQEAESLVVEIRRKGSSADAISADLETLEGAALLAKQARALVGDRLDVLVLNAGISKSARIGMSCMRREGASCHENVDSRSNWVGGAEHPGASCHTSRDHSGHRSNQDALAT